MFSLSKILPSFSRSFTLQPPMSPTCFMLDTYGIPKLTGNVKINKTK